MEACKQNQVSLRLEGALDLRSFVLYVCGLLPCDPPAGTLKLLTPSLGWEHLESSICDRPSHPTHPCLGTRGML